MKRKIIYLLVILITLSGVVFYFSKNSHISNDYLEASGCNEKMSNSAYTECSENALKKILIEKQLSYDRFQELAKSITKNALGLDEELNKEFQDWYKNSNDYNHSRCVASMYWSGAGSAYTRNVTVCEITETQRDIQLLDNLYGNKDYFKG